MNNIFKNVNIGKVATIASTVLGVAGVLLSNVVDKNNRNDMKNELKDELLKELTKTEK